MIHSQQIYSYCYVLACGEFVVVAFAVGLVALAVVCDAVVFVAADSGDNSFGFDLGNSL